MFGTFGFSYVGLIFYLMLIIPNLAWIKAQPQGYSDAGENRILLILEKTGQVLVTCFALFFSDYDPHGWSPWCGWLFAAAACMLLYEGWWIRYFRSGRTLADFYSSFCGIPVAGATLPVLAFLFLGIYGKAPGLSLSAILLGVGHIGIHWQHRKHL